MLRVIRNPEPLTFSESFKLFDGQECLLFFATGLISGIFLFLWAFLPPMALIKSYSYAMVPYLTLDNQKMQPNEVITKSRELMNGHKMDLFLIELSFIFWILGIFFTFGLLALYAIPYIQLVHVLYYLDLKQKDEMNSVE